MEQSQLRCQFPHVGSEVQQSAVIELMQARRGLFGRSIGAQAIQDVARGRSAPLDRAERLADQVNQNPLRSLAVENRGNI